MKKTIIFMVLSFVINLHSQWLDDYRLTNDPSVSYLGSETQKGIAVARNYVYVTWYDNRDGNDEIYFKRSTNHGQEWSNDIRLTYSPLSSSYPHIAASFNNVCISWEDSRNGNLEVYCKTSTDNGASWSSDIRVSNNAAQSNYPTLSCYGTNLVLIWTDNRDGNYELYFKRSPDLGISWNTETRLTDNSSSSNNPSISSFLQNIFVSWQDNRDGNYEIYGKRSTDGGLTWGSDMRLTIQASESKQSTVFVLNNKIFLAWRDFQDGNYEIYTKKSTDFGITWDFSTRLTNDISDSFFPFIVSSPEANNTIHLVWQDSRNGISNPEIYYKSSIDEGVNWSNDTRLTNNFSKSLKPSIAAVTSELHLVWQDERDGAPEIYYKRNLTGNSIGIQQISSEVPSGFNLSQNYPNPFNPTTNIKISVPKSEFVNLTVYDITGKETAVLVNENLNAGVFNVDFNASHLASGTYFYRITAGSFSEVKKMILVK